MNYITTPVGTNGRLGNSLFQIAAVISLAKKINATPVFPEWPYNAYLKNPLPTGTINPTHIYNEPYFHYTPIDLGEAHTTSGQVENKMFELRGYFQSEKYFQDCIRIIKEQFEFTYALKCKVAEKYRTSPTFLGSWPSCSVHIRRGDYVNNPYYADLQDLSYHAAALKYIRDRFPDVKVYIFSDDIDFCKDKFVAGQFEFIEGNSDIEDLCLMSMCDHNIICNSSFSWWGAWLNKNSDKIVVAPKKWFGENSVLYTNDLYCKNWVTI